jgi:hypothetical protein
MEKKEFQKLFKELMDTLKMPAGEVAKMIKVSFPTLKRWYDGVSAPHKSGRKSVIELLYAEQQHQEKVKFIKNVLKDSLTISINGPRHWEPYFKVNLKLDGEIFTTEYFEID